MLIKDDPDSYVPVRESTTCAFHLANPGVGYAGCACQYYYGLRVATVSEREENRKKRLEREKVNTALYSNLELINPNGSD
jgi:hypothetical protein